MARDYASFPRELSKQLAQHFGSVAFIRVTDSIYAQEASGFWRVVFFELSREDGQDFYVTYGVTVPQLGAPWFNPTPLKYSGLLISERLYHQSGQGFPCATKAELNSSLETYIGLHTATIDPWFSEHTNLWSVAAEYSRRWTLQAPGLNPLLVRQGVINYALMLYEAGGHNAARTWLEEAHWLASKAGDAEDVSRIAELLAAQKAS